MPFHTMSVTNPLFSGLFCTLYGDRRAVFPKISTLFCPGLGSPLPYIMCQVYPGLNASVSTLLCSAASLVKNNLSYTTYGNTGNFHSKNTTYLSQQGQIGKDLIRRPDRVQ